MTAYQSPPIYWICFILPSGKKELLNGFFFDEEIAESMANAFGNHRPEDCVILNRYEGGVYSTCLFSFSCSWIRASGDLRIGLARDLLKIRNQDLGSKLSKPVKSPFKFLCDGTAGLLLTEDEE